MLLTFCVLNTLVPNSAHVTAALRPARPSWLWSSGKENLCPGRGRPGGEAVGKERESEPRRCRPAWEEGMSPTCATSSPSFQYRIGAGWAGTQFSLLQPQAKAPSPRPSRRFTRSLYETTEAKRKFPAGQDRGTAGLTATRPRPAAPLLASARPGPGCPQHVSRRAPALRRPLPPPLSFLAAGADPRPLPAASNSAGIADSCRVLSAPPNLAPSLPQEPPFESAHAAPNLIGCGGRTRGVGGGAERARAAGGGAGEMEAGTGTRGTPGRSWETGGGAAGGARGYDCDRPRSARSRALRGGGAPRAARGLLGK